MKRIEIENLKALVMGHKMTLYQRSLAVSELHKVVDLLNELDKMDWCPLPDAEENFCSCKTSSWNNHLGCFVCDTCEKSI